MDGRGQGVVLVQEALNVFVQAGLEDVLDLGLVELAEAIGGQPLRGAAPTVSTPLTISHLATVVCWRLMLTNWLPILTGTFARR